MPGGSPKGKGPGGVGILLEGRGLLVGDWLVEVGAHGLGSGCVLGPPGRSIAEQEYARRSACENV